MRSKTVIYIGSFEMPDGNASANRVLSNAKALKALGYKVVFCGVSKSHDLHGEQTDFGFDNYPQKKERRVFKRIQQIISVDFYRKVIDSFSDVAAIFCYNLFAVQLRKIKKICAQRNILFVGDITEWYDIPFSLNLIKLLMFFDSNLAMRFVCKQFDAMICVSNYLLNHYRGYVKKIVRIPPLIDSDDGVWRAKKTTRGDSLVRFIYCGFPGKTKDRIDKIVKALYRHKSAPFMFLVAGITEQDAIKLYPSIRNAIRELGEKILFLGRVSHSKSIELLRDSDYLFLIREKTRRNNAGFPTKLVECLSLGTSFIANEFSDIKEYVGNKGIIIKDTDIESISAGINEALMRGHNEIGADLTLFDYRSFLDSFEDIIGES